MKGKLTILKILTYLLSKHSVLLEHILFEWLLSNNAVHSMKQLNHYESSN